MLACFIRHRFVICYLVLLLQESTVRNGRNEYTMSGYETYLPIGPISPRNA